MMYESPDSLNHKSDSHAQQYEWKPDYFLQATAKRNNPAAGSIVFSGQTLALLCDLCRTACTLSASHACNEMFR